MLDLDKIVVGYEKKKEAQRRRYAADPEYRRQSAERGRAWREANPDRCREYGKRRAAKRKAEAK